MKWNYILGSKCKIFVFDSYFVWVGVYEKRRSHLKEKLLIKKEEETKIIIPLGRCFFKINFYKSINLANWLDLHFNYVNGNCVLIFPLLFFQISVFSFLFRKKIFMKLLNGSVVKEINFIIFKSVRSIY